MDAKKMNFDMKKGERLKITGRYVTIYQEDGGLRYYSLNGKLLNKFSKKQLETARKVTWFCTQKCIVTKKENIWYVLTYDGKEICNFVATDVYSRLNSIVVKNGSLGIMLFDTNKLEFVEEIFDNILEDGRILVPKKENKYYLYDMKTNQIEKKFDFYAKYCKTVVEVDNSLIDFYVLYNDNKCGLYLMQRNREITEIFPIEYQQIKIDGNEIQTLKDGKIERYQLKALAKLKYQPYTKTVSDDNVEKKQTYQINFLNKVKVETGEELTVDGRFFSVLAKDFKSWRYYNLKGNYIGKSTSIVSNDMFLGPKNCIATENMIALGKGCVNNLYPSVEYWDIYDYEGNKIFENSFKHVEGYCSFVVNVTEFARNSHHKEYVEKYSSELIFSRAIENGHDKNFWAVFSKKGELLFTTNNVKEITAGYKHFRVVDNENKVQFLDTNGNRIFDEAFDNEKIRIFNKMFVVSKEKAGYIIYDFENKTKYYIEADLIEQEMFKEGNYKVYLNGKCGSISLNAEGYKIVVPIEYLDVEGLRKCILAKAEDGDDVYNLDGKKIYSTRPVKS